MSEKYDVIIIGAGIGGLVCGCYLAKAGLKVLIVEQHSKPGGYCTSFERKGFVFDAGPHYLGSLREDGILSQILRDVGVFDRIKFLSSYITDRFITPKSTVFFMKNKNKTKAELIEHFPKEKDNIERFFNLVANLNKNFLHVLAKTKNMSFAVLLDSFFNDCHLKSILSIPLISIGLTSSKASSIVSLVLFKEFMFDGGYYPEGGMREFPDLLLQRFKEFGGHALLSTQVSRIITRNSRAQGVSTNKYEVFLSKFVISNADATETFRMLLDCESKEAKIVDSLKPSISAFAVFLGLNKEIKLAQQHFLTAYFKTYDIERCYGDSNSLLIKDIEYIFCMFPTSIDKSLAPKGKSIVKLLVGCEYRSKDIWPKEKESLSVRLIETIEEIIPNLGNDVEVKELATPVTYECFTSNRNGAMFGWEANLNQVERNVSPPETTIENLYLTGHWVTNGIGQSSVPLVAFCGKNTAKLILRKIKA